MNQQVHKRVLEIVATLDRAMNMDTRRSVRNRWEAMQRECEYLTRNEDSRLRFIREKGWTPERLGVVCWLNSFYQLLLGPLEAATRASRLQLSVEIPIIHGTERFDATRRRVTVQAAAAFRLLIAELGIIFDWLTKHTARDLIYYIERAERDRDETLRLFNKE